MDFDRQDQKITKFDYHQIKSDILSKKSALSTPEYLAEIANQINYYGEEAYSLITLIPYDMSNEQIEYLSRMLSIPLFQRMSDSNTECNKITARYDKLVTLLKTIAIKTGNKENENKIIMDDSLEEAILRNDYKGVKKMLKSGEAPNMIIHNRTAFELAEKLNLEIIVELLSQFGEKKILINHKEIDFDVKDSNYILTNKDENVVSIKNPPTIEDIQKYSSEKMKLQFESDALFEMGEMVANLVENKDLALFNYIIQYTDVNKASFIEAIRLLISRGLKEEALMVINSCSPYGDEQSSFQHQIIEVCFMGDNNAEEIAEQIVMYMSRNTYGLHNFRAALFLAKHGIRPQTEEDITIKLIQLSIDELKELSKYSLYVRTYLKNPCGKDLLQIYQIFEDCDIKAVKSIQRDYHKARNQCCSFEYIMTHCSIDDCRMLFNGTIFKPSKEFNVADFEPKIIAKYLYLFPGQILQLQKSKLKEVNDIISDLSSQFPKVQSNPKESISTIIKNAIINNDVETIELQLTPHFVLNNLLFEVQNFTTSIYILVDHISPEMAKVLVSKKFHPPAYFVTKLLQNSNLEAADVFLQGDSILLVNNQELFMNLVLKNCIKTIQKYLDLSHKNTRRPWGQAVNLPPNDIFLCSLAASIDNSYSEMIDLILPYCKKISLFTPKNFWFCGYKADPILVAIAKCEWKMAENLLSHVTKKETDCSIVEDIVIHILDYAPDSIKLKIFNFAAPNLSNYILTTLIELGKLEVFNLLIDNGLDVEMTVEYNTNKYSLKTFCIIYGIPKMLIKLNESGIDFSGISSSMLDYAFKGRNPANIKYILSLNYAISDPTKYLISACQLGYTNIARYLIEKGADVNTYDPLTLKTPLHIAAKEWFPSLTRMLIEKGADVHAFDNEGNLALHKACAYGDLETVKLLIELGSLPLCYNIYGHSPFVIAVAYDRGDIVRFLLENFGNKIPIKEIRDIFLNIIREKHCRDLTSVFSLCETKSEAIRALIDYQIDDDSNTMSLLLDHLIKTSDMDLFEYITYSKKSDKVFQLLFFKLISFSKKSKSNVFRRQIILIDYTLSKITKFTESVPIIINQSIASMRFPIRIMQSAIEKGLSSSEILLSCINQNIRFKARYLFEKGMTLESINFNNPMAQICKTNNTAMFDLMLKYRDAAMLSSLPTNTVKFLILTKDCSFCIKIIQSVPEIIAADDDMLQTMATLTSMKMYSVVSELVIALVNKFSVDGSSNLIIKAISKVAVNDAPDYIYTVIRTAYICGIKLEGVVVNAALCVSDGVFLAEMGIKVKSIHKMRGDLWQMQQAGLGAYSMFSAPNYYVFRKNGPRVRETAALKKCYIYI